MSTATAVSTFPTIRVTIKQDLLPLHPRKEYENIGTFVAWHPRYALGDENISRDNAGQRLADVERSGALILPVYLYDHSGLTVRTTPFSCPWDSGQVGFIYITPKRGRAEFGRKWRKRARQCLEAEIEMLDQYLTGEVYSIEVAEISEDGTDVILDRCCGFYGRRYAETEADSYRRYYVCRALASLPLSAVTAPLGDLQSRREGWGVFSVDSRGQLTIQQYDVAEDFADDDAATRHVIARTLDGSAYHALALAVCLKSNRAFGKRLATLGLPEAWRDDLAAASLTA